MLLIGASAASANTPSIQTVGQAALNGQLALSLAHSVQTGSANLAVPVRLLSAGAGAASSLGQTNSSSAVSGAHNSNSTTQSATQSGSGGGGGSGDYAGQLAANAQGAGSLAESTQRDPTNTSVPIRILSPGGDSGSVYQSNDSSATSHAGNGNSTHQSVDQSGSGGSGLGIDAAGQAATNLQGAVSQARSTQTDPTNTYVPIRILSPGGDSGSVYQSNDSSASSHAGNGNSTTQSVSQDPSGLGLGIAAAGPSVQNYQGAGSSAESTQTDPTNTYVPIRILSPGDDSGSVDQSNDSSASSHAGNGNSTTQTVSQDPSGDPLGIAAAGQSAVSYQGAVSSAESTQTDPSNTYVPIRILSPGGDSGSVDQSNDSSATSHAGNGNHTTQSIGQPDLLELPFL
jgi:hypothetical protein